MIIMLILMLFPILSIPVFWLLPVGQAVAIYLVGLLFSASMYWIMHITHGKPVVTGREGLINRDVEIISKLASKKRSFYRVQTEGELWTARSDDIVDIGDTVTIVVVEGNTLNVKLKNKNSKFDLNNEKGGTRK